MFIKSGGSAKSPPLPVLTLLPILANTWRDGCYFPFPALRCAALHCARPSLLGHPYYTQASTGARTRIHTWNLASTRRFRFGGRGRG